ncbi:MAG: hypothetical protein HFF18_00165 [Oscillospiraceae bacterium]|nr:hypothetical protein [Oscillospiraceae bacterium]
MTLGRFLKGKLWLDRGEFLEILACWGAGLLFFEAVGNAIYFFLQRRDDTSSYFPLGPTLLLIFGAFFIVIFVAARFVLYFQLGVQMSVTRRRMLVGEWAVTGLGTVLALALIYGSFWLDRLLIAPLWGGISAEDDLLVFMPWWVWPLVGAASLLLGFVSGALVARFGTKGLWALWGVFVGGGLFTTLLGDNLGPFVEDWLIPFFETNSLPAGIGSVLLVAAVILLTVWQMLRFPVK